MSTNNTSAKNFISMSNKYDRVILLVDMDCFYCQVEEKLNPSLKNQPLAVVQYNAWRGGGIIAVNYAARARGVTRHMRGDEAKEQCPEIQLVKVPNVREKADLTKYREAGKDVANVLQRFTPLLERASVDEAYLDITEFVNKRLEEMNDGTFILQPQELVDTYAVGYQTIGDFVTTITTSFITNPLVEDDNLYRNFEENDVPSARQSNIRLLIGASIASEIRSAVKAETSYECSAGIAHNKILAKLACGINKPNKQTILPLGQIGEFFETLPIGKIKGLGAKFGEEICERLNVRYLGQLLKFTEAELQRKFDEKNGTWLYNICRGIDLEAVTPRFYSKSIGCCKKFPGRNNITGLKTLQHWLNELSNEIKERLEKDICENNRRAKQMVVSFIQEFDAEEISSSRSAPLQCYDTEVLTKTSLEIIRSNTKQFFRSGSESVLNNPIKFLGISVGKFETISNSQNNIQEMFAQQAAKKQKLKNESQTALATNLNTQNEAKPVFKTRNYTDNNINQQISKEKKLQNMNNLILTSENPVNSEIKSGFQRECESENTLLKQISKDKSSSKIRSFFLNALKKESPTTENNHIDEFVRTNQSFDELDTDLSNHLKLHTIPQNKLVTSSNNFFDDKNKVPERSFFAQHLNRKEGIIKNYTHADLTSDDPTEINSETNNSCKQLNQMNFIQNEKNFCNSELESENNNNTSDFNYALQLSDNVNPINNKRKYEQILDTVEPNQMDYRSKYVEFAIPELTTELLEFTKCSKCGCQILNNPTSIQTHEDHHFAQELSKQQRHEYRDEIRLKMMSSKSPPNNISNKKSKKVNLNTKTSADITRFLKPSNESQLSENNKSNTEICDICKSPIKMEEILEHKDFHIAKDLQRKLNQLEVRTVDVAKKVTFDSSRKTINTSANVSSQHNKGLESRQS